MQGNPYANGMSGNPQNFNPSSAPMVPPGFGSFNPASMTPEQQRVFEAKQQNMMRQLQANNAAAQQQHHMSRINPIANAQTQMAMQQAAIRQQNIRNMQNPLQGEIMPTVPDDFGRAIAQFMGSRGLPFSKDLIIGGRAIPCGNVFYPVLKMGGSKQVTMNNGWPQLAMHLNLHPTAAHEIATYWQQNLQAYELYYLQQRRMQQQQARIQTMQRDGNNITSQGPPGRPSNLNPELIAAAHARRQSGASSQPPGKPPMLGQQDPRQAQLNGFSPPRELNNQGLGAGVPGLQSLQKPTTPQDPEGLTPTPRGRSTQTDSDASTNNRSNLQPKIKEDGKNNASHPMSDTFEPIMHLFPAEPSTNETHGGIFAAEIISSERDQEYPRRFLQYPETYRYGNIDIHAVTMSLKSGLPGEVRLALNMLTSLTDERDRPRQLPALNECDDLLESLIDCAEVQLDFLADNAPEVSDVMMISPYEDLVRNCNSEASFLQDVPEFGSLDYELDRAADRLVSISTLLRNIGYRGQGDAIAIADSVVVKLFATVIRYLGTRNNLLRTSRNTLDFTKDVVLCLSNVSQYIKFSSKDEALCILQFLLSFGPLPHPSVTDINNDLSFPVYRPAVHRYLPPAVQALAKLLACGDPNRSYLKSLFATDLSSTPCFDLLTRAFGLCIAPVPEFDTRVDQKIQLRSRFLAQGLLAADSLVLMIPPTEHKLAHAWLASEDGFAHRLLRVIATVGINPPLINPAAINPAMARQRNVGPPQPIPLVEGHDMITGYGVSLLRKLAERAKDAMATSDGATGVHASIVGSEILKRNVLREALAATNVDPRLVQQLSAYASLDD